MNDDFASLYAYNRWADRRILEACRKLNSEQYAAEPVPGWTSVRTSVVHIAIVTEGWLRGVAGEVVETVPSEADLATVDDAERLLDRAYQTFQGLADRLTAELLATPRTFSGRGRTAVLPPWAALRHIVNHSTYHRGQIAAKLKRLGVDPPMTDMIFWVMEQTQSQAQARA
jgi:uncharacterized damage-inducible protein DinB